MKPIAHASSAAQSRLVALAVAAALPVLAACSSHSAGNAPCAGGECPGSGDGVPVSIAVADVNGDGVPDLLVAVNQDVGGLAAVILGEKSPPGAFEGNVPYYTGGGDPSGIAVADLTGSGSPDLVVPDYTSGSVAVFLHGATPGTFQVPLTITTGGQLNQVVAGDLTGSGGKRDLALADYSSAGNVIVLLHDAQNPGQFQAPIRLPASNFTTSVAIGSLGNGKTAIVAAAYDVSNDNGVVDVFVETSTSPVTFAAPVSFPAGAQPVMVRIADVNGDGLPDLIVANSGPGSNGTGMAGVSVLLQDAAHPGSFLAPVTYPTPSGTQDVAVGDLDGDGRPDLVVASFAPAPTGAVSVLLQNAAQPGTFGTATVYLGLDHPFSVAIADLNGDGHPDIAVADGASATVMLQNASAPGTFAPPVPAGD